MSYVKSFYPVIDAQSRVLILGSMPGVQSILEQQYYANPHNQFWRIIYSLFITPLDSNYSNRIEFIQKRGIALWDVIQTCQRAGSLDSNIKDEIANDFTGLFNSYPKLKLVAFNGTKAFRTYRKLVGFKLAQVDYQQLPSTSPANTIKFEEKFRQWKVILDYLK